MCNVKARHVAFLAPCSGVLKPIQVFCGSCLKDREREREIDSDRLIDFKEPACSAADV